LGRALALVSFVSPRRKPANGKQRRLNINPHFVSLETSDLTLALLQPRGFRPSYIGPIFTKPNEWDILCEPRNVILIAHSMQQCVNDQLMN
jgi:hypothetical protein